MALPKIDAPIYELDLPLSKKHIRFRPFLVKEQRNLMMAMESDDRDTIEKNIKQVLHNCTVTENIDIDELPIIDIEFYFINLRARSVGEVVENKYRCEAPAQSGICGNLMDVSINLLDIKVELKDGIKDIVQINDTISIKLKYPQFSIMGKAIGSQNNTDLAFDMIVSSIDYIYDGQQFYYAKESTKEELMAFIESLSTEQFERIEEFFNNLPTMRQKITSVCSKCGTSHVIEVEGLENFFG